jgi:hypothetical protein
VARRIPQDYRGQERGLQKANRNERLRSNVIFKGKSNALYNKLKKYGVKPIVPLSELNRMAKLASEKSKVDIRVSTAKEERGRNAFGAARGQAYLDTKNGKVWVRLHPVLQYETKKVINATIGHELDHIKVFNKQKTYKGKMIPRQ